MVPRGRLLPPAGVEPAAKKVAGAAGLRPWRGDVLRVRSGSGLGSLRHLRRGDSDRGCDVLPVLREDAHVDAFTVLERSAADLRRGRPGDRGLLTVLRLQ